MSMTNYSNASTSQHQLPRYGKKSLIHFRYNWITCHFTHIDQTEEITLLLVLLTTTWEYISIASVGVPNIRHSEQSGKTFIAAEVCQMSQELSFCVEYIYLVSGIGTTFSRPNFKRTEAINQWHWPKSRTYHKHILSVVIN